MPDNTRHVASAKCTHGMNEDLSTIYLSSKSAAAYLHMSLSTFYKLTASRKIKVYKPNGKLLLIKKSDLDRWISRGKIHSQDELLD